MSDFKTIAKVGTITEGQGKAFPLAGKMIAVFNDGGTYRAIDDFCPHMGASLAEGYLEDGVVACPWHAWRFDVCSGKWCDNPTLGVTTYEIRVVDDEIQVKIPPADDKSGESGDSDSPQSENGQND